jgi:outer membrane protein TolC
MTTCGGIRRHALLALAGLGLVVPGAGGQERVTLEDAVARALERSPALAQSAEAVQNAGWTRRTAVGAFLPSVSTSSSMSIRSSRQQDPTTGELRSGSSDSYGAGVSASYDLFSGLSRVRDLEAAGAGVEAAEARMVDQRYGVVLATQQVFFEALEQGELLEVARQRVAQAEESLGLTRTRANLREATTSDTLRARLEYVNARQVLLQAESALRTAEVSLGRQVGVPGPVEPVAPEGLGPRPLALSEEAILDLAVGAAPSVRAAEASAVAARANASASRAAYVPSLRMSSGYNWANQAASFEGGATNWSVGFSASYPLFNGFQREATVARASESLRVARLQEEDARLAARAEADAALRTLQTAEQAILIAEEAVAVAEEDLRVIQERYRVGVARIFDVVQSQIALDQARVDLVGARYDYVLARAELEAVVGREL